MIRYINIFLNDEIYLNILNSVNIIDDKSAIEEMKGKWTKIKINFEELSILASNILYEHFLIAIFSIKI